MEPRARARGNDLCEAGQLERASASMEPRARARGNNLIAAFVTGSQFASMEPRARARGNAVSALTMISANLRFNGAARTCARK